MLGGQGLVCDIITFTRAGAQIPTCKHGKQAPRLWRHDEAWNGGKASSRDLLPILAAYRTGSAITF